MPKLPARPVCLDGLRDAIFGHYERTAEDHRRPHLGCSVIGTECERALWYGFRWVQDPEHPGRILALFQRGHREEERLIIDLRAIGVEVEDIDPQTGEQYRMSAVGGHFGGSCDGIIKLGVPGIDLLRAVFEAKTSNDKAFKKLEKEGVRLAKPEHYAQVVVYMEAFQCAAAVYVSVNKNDDQIHAEKVEPNPEFAAQLLEKASRVIFAQTPPPRLSDDPSWWKCRFCSFRPVCHQQETDRLERNCRSCLSSTAEPDGTWSCAHLKRTLSVDEQKQGCSDHLFIPDLLPWEQTDAHEEHRFVDYLDENSEQVRDRGGEFIRW
ncbi:MAG: PD-(D/E)XK nuclease family protein [Planctomycetota bacterium]